MELKEFLCSSTDGQPISHSQGTFGEFKTTERFSIVPKPASEISQFGGDEAAVGFNKRHSIRAGSEAFVEPGTDVTLHIIRFHERDNFNSSKAVITVLLNHQPVDATIENYSAERDALHHTEQGTTATFPIDADAEQYDITIPATEFEGRGRHTLSFIISGVGDPNTMEQQGEKIVHYGGCTPNPMPCMRKADALAPNDVEDSVNKEVLTEVTLFPTGQLSEADPLSDIRVAPEQKIELQYSARLNKYTWNAMFIPLLDGKPVGEPDFVQLPPEPEENADELFFVGGRNKFKLTMPEQEGEYRVEIGAIRNPTLTRQEALGMDLMPTAFSLGSNSLRFVVEAE
jgi:hypothetical protein